MMTENAGSVKLPLVSVLCSTEKATLMENKESSWRKEQLHVLYLNEVQSRARSIIELAFCFR